ncbi:LTA synthase family protein [Solibacillus ferritrahens]|uniref:LTA synthase family protein n=1 Tax=Solibacillus ferritrahens TaxID=3098620 RepID=UPI003009EB93
MTQIKKILTTPLLKMYVSILFSLVISFEADYYKLAVTSAIEIFLITIITGWIFKKRKIVAYIFNSLLTLMVLAQVISWLFSGGYISAIMIGNIAFVKALGDELPMYILGSAIIVFISFYPIFFSGKKFRLGNSKLVSAISLVILAFIIGLGLSKEPVEDSALSNLFHTGRQIAESKYKTYMLKRTREELIAKQLGVFEKRSVEDGSKKPSNLGSKPNVIIIWTEGMSKELIDGSIKDLMPNMQNFESKSISFEDYYNHTAATLRGLRGQMISGYQYPDLDVDPKSLQKNRLVSLEDIMNDKGYETIFINSEPNIEIFTDFLNSLRYDKVVDNGDLTGYTTDKELFEQLATVSQKVDQPYFLGTYNIGTHHGFDSAHVKYGDGKDKVLNRWANYDRWFGQFFGEFQNNSKYDNTILIVTTDHASYNSPEYKEALNSTQETFISEIPFMIYYKGVEPKKISVSGRNSLNLTPTILDLLDYEKEKNYFLGSSLFDSKEVSAYETISAIGDIYYKTSVDGVKEIKDITSISVIKNIQDFYLISSK